MSLFATLAAVKTATALVFGTTDVVGDAAESALETVAGSAGTISDTATDTIEETVGESAKSGVLSKIGETLAKGATVVVDAAKEHPVAAAGIGITVVAAGGYAIYRKCKK